MSFAKMPIENLLLRYFVVFLFFRQFMDVRERLSSLRLDIPQYLLLDCICWLNSCIAILLHLL